MRTLRIKQGFPCGSAGKELPAMRETWVGSLGWEDPLDKGKATHSSITNLTVVNESFYLITEFQLIKTEIIIEGRIYFLQFLLK